MSLKQHLIAHHLIDETSDLLDSRRDMKDLHEKDHHDLEHPDRSLDQAIKTGLVKNHNPDDLEH
jgi:hypothetical protein